MYAAKPKERIMANEENKHGIENSQSKKVQKPIRAKKPNGGGPPDPLTAPRAPRKRASPQDTVIKTNYQPPLDAIDLAGLYEDRGQGDPLAQTRHSSGSWQSCGACRLGCDGYAFRRILNFYFLKKEGTIDEKPFLVGDEMLGLMEGEARPAVLTTCVLRDGSIELCGGAVHEVTKFDVGVDRAGWLSPTERQVNALRTHFQVNARL
jgi:hypothetical protein